MRLVQSLGSYHMPMATEPLSPKTLLPMHLS